MILASRLRMGANVAPAPPALSIRYMGRGFVTPDASGDGTVNVTNTAAATDLIVAVVVAWDAVDVGTGVFDAKAGGSGGTSMRRDSLFSGNADYVGCEIFSIANPGGSSLDVWVNAASGVDTIVVALYAITGSSPAPGVNSAYYGQEAVVAAAHDDIDESSPTLVSVAGSTDAKYVTAGGVIGWKAGGTAETLSVSNATDDAQVKGTQYTYSIFSAEGVHSFNQATVSTAHTSMIIKNVKYKLEQV